MAESMPIDRLTQAFNAQAAIRGRPTRSENAICLKLNDLKLSVTPLYQNFTTTHIAKVLKISDDEVYYWIRRCGLKTYRLSNKNRAHHFINVADLRRFVRERPEFFGGLDSTELFLLIEDRNLVDYVKTNFPRRYPKRAGPMKVKCIETGQVFQSQADAAKTFHLYRSALYRAVKYGEAVAGYHFKRVD